MNQHYDHSTSPRSQQEDAEIVLSPQIASEEKTLSESSSAIDLMDTIDSLLEENAEEFVNSYVQKGGQ